MVVGGKKKRRRRKGRKGGGEGEREEEEGEERNTEERSGLGKSHLTILSAIDPRQLCDAGSQRPVMKTETLKRGR